MPQNRLPQRQSNPGRTGGQSVRDTSEGSVAARSHRSVAVQFNWP